SFETRSRLDQYIHALQAVINRHDILRTAIRWEGLSQPVQVVYRNAQLHVQEVELDPALGDVGEQMFSRFNPRQFRIDIRQAPLLRLYATYDDENGRWLLMTLLHHLVFDHITFTLMQSEIEAHLLGREGSLAVPLPFRHLVAQARLGLSRQEHERFF